MGIPPEGAPPAWASARLLVELPVHLVRNRLLDVGSDTNLAAAVRAGLYAGCHPFLISFLQGRGNQVVG